MPAEASDPVMVYYGLMAPSAQFDVGGNLHAAGVELRLFFDPSNRRIRS